MFTMLYALIMFIGGVVLSFKGEMHDAFILYAIAAFCLAIGEFNVMLTNYIDKTSDRRNMKEAKETIEAINEFLDKVGDDKEGE